MSIKTKIIFPMLGLMVLIAAGVLVSNIILFSNYVDNIVSDRVEVAAKVAEHEFGLLKEAAYSASMYVSEYPGVIQAVANRDRQGILNHAGRIQREIGMDFCTVTDAAGVVLARTHEPDNYGDSVANQTNVRAAMSGRTLMAIETGTVVRLSIRAGAPVYDGDGNLVGVVSIGMRLDTNDFVDGLKSLLGAEATIFLGDERISTTVIGSDGARAIGTTALEEISRGVLSGNTYLGLTNILGRRAFTSYSPIYGPEGEVVGMLFVGRYTAEGNAVIWTFVQSGLIITLALLLIALAIMFTVVRHITKPLILIGEAAETLALGDIEIDDLDAGTGPTKDEIIRVERSFNKMIESFKHQAYILTRVAEGDYTSQIDVRSEKDVINLSIELMLNGTLDVLHQVATAGIQVADSSRQISEGAQNLASGSVEQSRTIEELSESIADVAMKTKANEEMAEEAVRNNDVMRKIVTLIDNIASQTNIIALNAAVEAARAGQSGSAFAVVAQEVRVLALKSKESLLSIEEGINESIRLVDEIANASKEQSLSIEKINKRIEQVEQVVLQNSATAEESAAASHEMSSQSKMLEDLIMQFQLRESLRQQDAE
ncbi:MAG: cache domain-containing protein [Oscillospiraceae bacterium]|nr:cache domain-containing protein [Oscillospiraceae bacterium]